MRIILLFTLLASNAFAALAPTSFDDVITRNAMAIGKTTAADTKAVLELSSTTKVMLPPRMTTAQRTAISSPPEGSFVYDTDLDAFFAYTGSLWRQYASLAGTETLTNKTLSGNTATNLISGSGTLTLNTSGTITVPNATDTLVGKATTDTLTNKTLSGNTATNLISGSGILTLNTSGTATVPNATDTLVGKATTDTLTNKTIAAGSNTITGLTNTNLSGTAGITDANLATISTAGKVSNSATTATNANTASAIVARDGSGNFSAGTITATLTGNVTGALTGNASTATALAANPTDCSSNQFANAIAESGNLTCAQPSFTDISGTLAATAGGTAQSTYTTGDMLYASASNTLSKLAIGSTGTVLKVSGGIPTWSSNSISATSVTKTSADSPYTASTEDTIYLNAASGAITVNLPAAASNSGKKYQIIKTDTSANLVTVDPNSSETIGVDTTWKIGGQDHAIQIECDGTKWRVIANEDPMIVEVHYTGQTLVDDTEATMVGSSMTETKDTHNVYNTGTGVITSARAAVWSCSAAWRAAFASEATRVVTTFNLAFNAGGSRVISNNCSNATASQGTGLIGCPASFNGIYLLASDTITPRAYQNSAGNHALDTSDYNHVTCIGW